MIQRFQQVELIPADAVMAEACPEAGQRGYLSVEDITENAFAAHSRASRAMRLVLCHMPVVRANQS